MDSGFDETPQEGAAGASVALASERKVPTLSAVEDLDGATDGRQSARGCSRIPGFANEVLAQISGEQGKSSRLREDAAEAQPENQPRRTS